MNDYSEYTLLQLTNTRKAIQMQKDSLDELDEKIIAEIGKRAAERVHRDLKHIFGF